MHKMWKAKTEKSNRNELSDQEKIKLRAETSAAAFIESATNTFKIWENFKLLATGFVKQVNVIDDDFPIIKYVKTKHELAKKYLNFKSIESKLDPDIFDPLIELLSDAKSPKLIYNEIPNLEAKRESWCKKHVDIVEIIASLEHSYKELEIKLNEYRKAMLELKNLILNQIEENTKLSEKSNEINQTLKFIENELNNPRTGWLENINKYIATKKDIQLQDELKKSLNLILTFHVLVADAEIYQDKIDPIKAIINFDQPTTNRNKKSFDHITESYILTSLIEIYHLDGYLKKKKTDLSVPLPSPPIEDVPLEAKDDSNNTTKTEEQLLREREKLESSRVKKIKHKYKHKSNELESKATLSKLPLNRAKPPAETTITTSSSIDSSVESSTPRSLTSDSPPFKTSPVIPILNKSKNSTIKKSKDHEQSSSSSQSDSSSESLSPQSGSAHSPSQAMTSHEAPSSSAGFFSRSQTLESRSSPGEEKFKTTTTSKSSNSSPKKYLTTGEGGLFKKSSKRDSKEKDPNDIMLKPMQHECKPRQET